MGADKEKLYQMGSAVRDQWTHQISSMIEPNVEVYSHLTELLLPESAIEDWRDTTFGNELLGIQQFWNDLHFHAIRLESNDVTADQEDLIVALPGEDRQTTRFSSPSHNFPSQISVGKSLFEEDRGGGAMMKKSSIETLTKESASPPSNYEPGSERFPGSLHVDSPLPFSPGINPDQGKEHFSEHLKEKSGDPKIGTGGIFSINNNTLQEEPVETGSQFSVPTEKVGVFFPDKGEEKSKENSEFTEIKGFGQLSSWLQTVSSPVETVSFIKNEIETRDPEVRSYPGNQQEDYSALSSWFMDDNDISESPQSGQNENGPEKNRLAPRPGNQTGSRPELPGSNLAGKPNPDNNIDKPSLPFLEMEGLLKENKSQGWDPNPTQQSDPEDIFNDFIVRLNKEYKRFYGK